MSLPQDWLAGAPVVTDGAWGTQLQALGLEPGAAPDPWNIEHPGRVHQVAAAYVEAGSRIILTNTFRANRISLHAAPWAGRLGEINREGVRISKDAASGRALVFASMGPSGKMLLTGETTPEALFEAFAEQAAALAAGGADALLVETQSDIEEAAIALQAARTTGLPTVVSFVFDSGRNKDRTMMGATPEQVGRRMAGLGASAAGANCGSGIENFAAVCRRLKEASGLPVWIKPNAGLPAVEDGRAVYTQTPDEFASHAEELIEAGASFIGGCCGTSPAFIAALSRRLRG
jgi:methionine synthase I (cobalamin-dependent)